MDSFKRNVRDEISGKLSRYFGVTYADATPEQIYKATVMNVKDILTAKRSEFNLRVKETGAKKVYYLCMEFLIGKQLSNALHNLGLYDVYSEVLADMGFSMDSVTACEPDPALGNGGLGRLAACYMDALTSLNYPATGFSLCYEYGLFKQKIYDGEQVELPDVWLPGGEVWLTPRNDRVFTVRFGGTVREKWKNGKLDIIYENCEEVQAVPYDFMISGYDCKGANNLRLWKARSLKNVNMSLFSQGQYIKAMEDSTNAEIISKVLYPSDNHSEGKILRLTQQYFLVSASLQNILDDHLRRYGTLARFTSKNAIHINDTHPALVIPELMRILIDIYSFSWEDAWDTVINTVSYTNHTVMPEALECWGVDIFKLKLPRLYSIISEINTRFCADLWKCYPGDWDRISRMSIIANGQVRMANLSVVGSHKVNGVSDLHTKILKDTVFHDFDKYTPSKIINVTNGIAYRRWLCYSNKGLADLLDSTVGPMYRKDSARLSDFKKYASDKAVLESLKEIKKENKEKFALFARGRYGATFDPDSFFDVQIKRMHEYKRQLLNVLKIFSVYLRIKDNPSSEHPRQTFIFGGKAAQGYYMAKRIIKLICALSEEIAKDPVASKYISVVYLEDYNVSVAENLIPAADLSEQISLAGKEASGTGNMKLMINGALTLGTLDGANVEIFQAVGSENIYLFGLKTEEVADLWQRGYSSGEYYNKHAGLRRVVDYMCNQFRNGEFSDFMGYLVNGGGVPDPFMCFADFESYLSAYASALKDYENPDKWFKMSAINIASAGIFSADRSIHQYAKRIWRTTPVE